MLPAVPGLTPMSTVGRLIKRGADGFTLFELLIVIVVLAIVAGVVVPNIDFRGSEGGAKRLAGFVQQALDEGRNHARLRRESVTIRFTSRAVQVGDGKATSFPGSARFVGLDFAGDDDKKGDELIVDRRGILPLVIIRMKIDGQLYSLFVNPVLRESEYREGIAHFDDFANWVSNETE